MVLIDEVKVGNMALSHIGARTNIESLSEESAEADAIETWFEVSRVQLLEAFDWNFARKRLQLALHADPPPEKQWLFRYQYPSDCVTARVLENPFGDAALLPNTIFSVALGPQADAIPFEVENSPEGTLSILTNLEEARLRYTFDLQNLTLYSLEAIQALSHILASHIAFTLTGKTIIQDKQLATFFTIIRFAHANNANEHVAEPPRDAAWHRVR